jgi:hypothetical protein
MRETGETMSLVIEQNGEAVYLLRAEFWRLVRAIARPESRVCCRQLRAGEPAAELERDAANKEAPT